MRLGYRMKIGYGKITSVWNDPWVRDLPNFQVQYMIMYGLEDLKVSDLLLELVVGMRSLSTIFLVRLRL